MQGKLPGKLRVHAPQSRVPPANGNQNHPPPRAPAPAPSNRVWRPRATRTGTLLDSHEPREQLQRRALRALAGGGRGRQKRGGGNDETNAACSRPDEGKRFAHIRLLFREWASKPMKSSTQKAESESGTRYNKSDLAKGKETRSILWNKQNKDTTGTPSARTESEIPARARRVELQMRSSPLPMESGSLEGANMEEGRLLRLAGARQSKQTRRGHAGRSRLWCRVRSRLIWIGCHGCRRGDALTRFDSAVFRRRVAVEHAPNAREAGQC